MFTLDVPLPATIQRPTPVSLTIARVTRLIVDNVRATAEVTWTLGYIDGDGNEVRAVERRTWLEGAILEAAFTAPVDPKLDLYDNIKAAIWPAIQAAEDAEAAKLVAAGELDAVSALPAGEVVP